MVPGAHLLTQALGGCDANGQGGEAFAPFTYACRPPGAYHGPFLSKNGCLLLEMHYFDPA